MPILESRYNAPFLLRNAHLNTIYPNYFRKLQDILAIRTRLDTPDGDFLDIDITGSKSDTAVVVVHGLEGSSRSNYMLSMTHALVKQGWDCICMNMRGCSGEGNRLYSSYHSGKTDDLQLVLEYMERELNYKNVFLVGFSLGGNLVLKYAGEQGYKISRRIKAIAAVSVPCDLRSAAYYMKNVHGSFYLRRLLRALKKKALDKAERFHGRLDASQLNLAKDFKDFDDLYTAPAHGFRDAEEYWRLNSSKPLLSSIRAPAYLLNAKDDPFLAPECYPYAEAEASSNFFFEAPEHGGHVGFMRSYNMREPLYHEISIVEFFRKYY